MLVYMCDGLEDDDLGEGGNCDTDVSSNIKQCLQSLLIAAWAVGGSVSNLAQNSSVILTSLLF